eukprot:350561-Chlamydomonas_euryale.AAC.22
MERRSLHATGPDRHDAPSAVRRTSAAGEEGSDELEAQKRMKTAAAQQQRQEPVSAVWQERRKGVGCDAGVVGCIPCSIGSRTEDCSPVQPGQSNTGSRRTDIRQTTADTHERVHAAQQAAQQAADKHRFSPGHSKLPMADEQDWTLPDVPNFARSSLALLDHTMLEDWDMEGEALPDGRGALKLALRRAAPAHAESRIVAC